VWPRRARKSPQFHTLLVLDIQKGAEGAAAGILEIVAKGANS
jgi:hypothetical protein